LLVHSGVILPQERPPVPPSPRRKIPRPSGVSGTPRSGRNISRKGQHESISDNREPSRTR
jgi:hypothetical protein